MLQNIVYFQEKHPQYPPFLTKIPSVHIYSHLIQFKEGILEFNLKAFIISFNLV